MNHTSFLFTSVKAQSHTTVYNIDIRQAHKLQIDEHWMLEKVVQCQVYKTWYSNSLAMALLCQGH